MHNGEVQILVDEVPAEVYAELVEDMQEAGRYACANAVPPGYDHNCFNFDESLGPGFSVPFPDDTYASPDCIGWCGYANDPPFGSCGPDPDPWACNDDSPAGGTAETGDTGGASDGGDVGGPRGVVDRRAPP